MITYKGLTRVVAIMAAQAELNNEEKG